MFLNGEEMHTTTARGEDVQDESFLVLFNAHHEPLTFRMPTRRFGRAGRWSSRPRTAAHGEEGRRRRGEQIEVESRSIVVLRNVA